MDTGRVAFHRPIDLLLPQADGSGDACAASVVDRLPALALHLAPAGHPERLEKPAVERKRALDRADHQVDVIEQRESQGAVSLRAFARRPDEKEPPWPRTWTTPRRPTT